MCQYLACLVYIIMAQPSWFYTAFSDNIILQVKISTKYKFKKIYISKDLVWLKVLNCCVIIPKQRDNLSVLEFQMWMKYNYYLSSVRSVVLQGLKGYIVILRYRYNNLYQQFWLYSLDFTCLKIYIVLFVMMCVC